MLQKMLVPLDGSPLAACALPHLATLARLTGAEIHLLRVLETNTLPTEAIDPIDWHLRKAEARIYLQEVETRLRELSCDTIEIEVMEGPAATCIVEYAVQNAMDLIVLSSHGRSGLSPWNVSSVAQKVIQRAGCSVFLSRAYMDAGCHHATFDAARYRRIAVTLDGSFRAETILPLASALAEQHGAELFLVHVVQRPAILERTPRTPEDESLLAQLLERNYNIAVRYFEELQGRLSPRVRTHILVEPDICFALHEFVADNEIDLVVTTAHGASGRTRWPYGATATSFILYGTTPLLVLQDAPLREIEPMLAERIAAAPEPQHRIQNYAGAEPQLN